jgi:5-methylthioadenosine/S-adenosylhomocysteine deaminase
MSINEDETRRRQLRVEETPMSINGQGVTPRAGGGSEPAQSDACNRQRASAEAARGTSLSRRGFLLSGAVGLAAAGMAGGARRAAAQQVPPEAPESLGERVLIRGGCVLTVDPRLGDFERADVLIEGSRIAAVGPDLDADADSIIDAAGMIVMPGFVDTHRHMWQGALRNILPDGLLSDYGRDITGAARSVFRPEDARVGDLVSALGAINAGVTTVLDWSHIGNSPEHTDAAIEGLRESGVRAVYAFGGGAAGASNRFPDDIRRLRAEHFSSDDQLLTLAMAAGTNPSDWQIARDVGAFISVHIVGSLGGAVDALGPDVTCIHCTNLQPEAWRRMADAGVGVSIAGPIEMQMSHGVPPIQEALAHGIRPSLSVDVETQQPSEFFTQMRSIFSLQRMLAIESQRRGEVEDPVLLSVRDVVELATLQGAKDNHLDHKVGSLTPGKEADLVLLRADTINVLPVNNAYGAVVLAMDTANVDTVLIGGALRKRHGRLVGVDVDRVRRMAEASRDYILEATGWPSTLLGGYLPGH